MIKVSVIIPVYNVEKYLSDCLESVLAQYLYDFECICIDDASPDRCGEILDEYAFRDSRIKVLHLAENHMQGYGRNLGMREAKGEYVYFLDADDMIKPETLDVLYVECKKNTLDGAFFDSHAIFETEKLERRFGSYKGIRTGHYPEYVCSGLELLDCFAEQNEYLVYVQREFWRKDFLIENNIFFPEQRTEHEDELFSFKAILLAKRIKYIRKPFFIRRFRGNSDSTRKPMPDDFHGYFITFNQMAAFAEKHGLTSSGIDYCMMYMWECVQNYATLFSEEDPKIWFSEEEQEWYRLYRAILKSQKMVNKRDKLIFALLRDAAQIEIFGAGRIAQAICRRVVDLGFDVSGFWVSEAEGNPTELYGIPIRLIADYQYQPEKSVMIVAVAKQWHTEVMATLEQLNLKYYLYETNFLRGPFGKTNAGETRK